MFDRILSGSIKEDEEDQRALTLEALQFDLDDNLSINELAAICRFAADQWYYDPHNGMAIKHNVGERIALMHSELSEAFEAARKNKKDDHIPSRMGIEVELADAMIRILDFAGENNLDIGGAFWEKLRYNVRRLDHKPENRAKDDGKKF